MDEALYQTCLEVVDPIPHRVPPASNQLGLPVTFFNFWMVYDGLLMQILMQISLDLMGFIDQNLSIHVNTSVVLWPVVFKQSCLKRSN